MNDFFNDLRDRNLLPIIGLLVVCLIAVPFLLGGDGEEPAAPTPSATAGGPLPGIETRPVVVATPAELRSYRKRLASFRSRNPFHQNLPEPIPEAGTGAGTGADTGIGDSGLSATGTSDAGISDPGTAPVPSTEPTTIPPTAGDDGTSGDQLIEIRVDVKVGLAGKLKTVKNVRSLDYLPDPQRPVVQYISGEFNLSGAAFVVSPGIEATDGEGKCSPSPDNCQFLLLKPGERQNFVYRAERYQLELLEVKRHVQPLEEGDLERREPADTPRGSVRNPSSAVEGG